MTPEFYRSIIYWGKIIGVVGALAAAIVSTAAAWPIIEPYVAAHRGYVRQVAGEVSSSVSESRKVIRDLQVESAEGKRDQIEEAHFKWKIELGKATDDQTRSLIIDRIRELERTKQKLENQIDTLNKVRGQ